MFPHPFLIILFDINIFQGASHSLTHSAGIENKTVVALLKGAICHCEHFVFVFFSRRENLNFGFCSRTMPANGNKTQICNLNKSVDNSLSTSTVSSISELLSPGDKLEGRGRWEEGGRGGWRGGTRQTHLMRNNGGTISLFSDALLPADAWYDMANVHQEA